MIHELDPRIPMTMVQCNKKAKAPKHAHRVSGQTKRMPLSVAPPNRSIAAGASDCLRVELQQQILDVFTAAFPIADHADLGRVIQEIKGHLYRRDFSTAFAFPEHLSAYALRWSATRALAYTPIFAELDLAQTPCSAISERRPSDGPPACKLVCIGGGAGAEVVACAAALGIHDASTKPSLDMTVVDMADWSETLSKLHHGLKMQGRISPYASESARAAIRPLITPAAMQVHFTHCDILRCEDDRLQSLLRGVSLVTLMFTLNELFTASNALTSTFLCALTAHMPPDSRLLVVDSPGSYSEVNLGMTGQAKRYPMKWLLDHTLLQVAGQGRWTKLVEEDSRWFRTHAKLKYPLDLESTRYQMHLYQKQPGRRQDDP